MKTKSEKRKLALAAIIVTVGLWGIRKCQADDALYFNPNKDDFKIAELNELSVEYKDFQGQARNPLLYPLIPTSSLNVRINVDVLKYGFFRNDILTNSVSSQFKSIGWHYQVGFTVFDIADIYFDHQSLHILDGTIQTMPGYPVENSLAVRVYVFRKDSR